MAKVLYIQASPRTESFSTRLANAFAESYRKTRPDDRTEVLDLFAADIPLFTAPAAKAKYAVMGGQPPRDAAETAWQGVIKVINHFKGFDKYVLSCPMWNFGIPYRLKQYIDVIVQPGLTFSYSPEKGYSGLVAGRPLMLLLARGGTYPAGNNPAQTMDFQESYLRAIFGYMGFTEIRTVIIDGTLAKKPEQLEADTAKAIAAAGEAAVQFAQEAVLTA